MNSFQILEHVQGIYKTYVYAFQKIRDPVIREWVVESVAQ